MAPPDFFIKAGDTASIISATLTDDGGVAVDIEGATVAFHMAPISGSGATAQFVNAAATNHQSGATANIGEVSYEWGAGQTDVADLYVAEWQVTYADSEIQTFPNGGYVLVQISEQVA